MAKRRERPGQISWSTSRILDRMGFGLDPVEFGMPDLLEPGISNEEQDRRLKQAVEGWLRPMKDGRALQVCLIPEMVEFIACLFFGRAQKVILWKPRGGGGTLCAGIFAWLILVYKHKSIIDYAGSGDQAKMLYEYTVAMWDCVPGMADAFIDGEPMITETRLKNGTSLKCVPASMKRARSKHTPVVLIDEACQEDPRVEKVMKAALQAVFTEDDFVILLLSTFHIPFGIFQQYWDEAVKRGYRRVKWNIYQVMRQCDAGMSTATPEDPTARHYCRTQCPLTEAVQITEQDGTVRTVFEGCDGLARTTTGHMTRAGVIAAKEENAGGETWRVEFECRRPKTQGPVYDTDDVTAAGSPEIIEVPAWAEKRVGIDWGRKCAVVVLCAMLEDKLVVARGHVLFNKRVHDVLGVLHRWRDEFGAFEVFADAENAYANNDVTDAGFTCTPVAFNKYKVWGIENLDRYLSSRRITISTYGDLEIVHTQMLLYHTDERGKPVKKDDHGPDALMCATVGWLYSDVFGAQAEDKARRVEEEDDDVLLL